MKVATWYWDHSKQEGHKLLLLLALADWCDDEGECYPRVGRLAKKIRRKPRATQQAITELEQAGELLVHPGMGKGPDGQRSSLYYLLKYRQAIGLEIPPIISEAARHYREKMRKQGQKGAEIRRAQALLLDSEADSAVDCTPTGAVDCTPTGAVDCTPTGAVDCTPTGAVDCTPTGAVDCTQIHQYDPSYRSVIIDPSGSPSIPSSIARDQQSNGHGMDGFHPIADSPILIQKPMPTNGNGLHPAAASQSQRTQPATPSAPLSEAPPEPLRTLAMALIDEQLPEWRNPARHVDSRSGRDLHNLLTWLWLIKRLAEVAQLNPHSPEGYWAAVDTAPYLAALDGITDRIGYIVSRTGGGKELRSEAAPLIRADLEALTEAIEQFRTESEVTP